MVSVARPREHCARKAVTTQEKLAIVTCVEGDRGAIRVAQRFYKGTVFASLRQRGCGFYVFFRGSLLKFFGVGTGIAG